MKESKFWIFSHFIEGIPVFERCTEYEERAKERVEELKKMYKHSEAFYSKDLPDKFYS